MGAEGCNGGGGVKEGRACCVIVDVLGDDAKEYKKEREACFLERTGYHFH